MFWDDGLARMAATTKTGGSAAVRKRKRKINGKEKHKNMKQETKGTKTYISNRFGQMST